jgi:dTMP kinase
VSRSLRARRGKARLRAVALIGIDGSGKTTQAHGSPLRSTRRHSATYHRNAGGRRWLGRLAHGSAARTPAAGRAGRMLVVESVLRWLAIARAASRVVTGRTGGHGPVRVRQYASIARRGAALG